MAYNTQYEGTVKPTAGFNAETDADQLRKAMKGLGTNEAAVTNVLGNRTVAERQEIVRLFKTLYGKDLKAELKSELSGNYKLICTGLCLSQAEFDARSLNDAIKGAGTDDQGLVEVLCIRTNAEIKAFAAAYKTKYKTTLEKDIAGDTSGHFKRLLVSLLQANRDENPAVDQAKAEQDARKLYDAGEQKLGTDESTFNMVLVSRSNEHLRAVFDEYRKVAGKDIEDSLKSEMSGDLLNGFLTVVRCIKDKPSVFAKVLHKSMKGLGTDDNSLIRVVVSRADIDMVQIKQAFLRDYGKTLASFISGDCSGDYKKILLALIGEPK